MIVGLSIACSATRGSQNTPNSRKTTSMYRIKKIVDEETFFIIYAVRNDSTFKIISDAVGPLSRLCIDKNDSTFKIVSVAVEDSTTDFDGEKIRVGKSYTLDLKKTFPGAMDPPNPGIRGIGIGIGNGKFATIDVEKKSHYALYFARNLNGLYLKKD